MSSLIVNINDQGIKTTRSDTSKTGFILANDQDISEMFLTTNNISLATSGSGNMLADISVSVSGNKLILTKVMGSSITGYCTYCNRSSFDCVCCYDCYTCMDCAPPVCEPCQCCD